jgi:hypothetical protein
MNIVFGMSGLYLAFGGGLGLIEHIDTWFDLSIGIATLFGLIEGTPTEFIWEST